MSTRQECNICHRPIFGTEGILIPGGDMQRAVKAGFNPMNYSSITDIISESFRTLGAVQLHQLEAMNWKKIKYERFCDETTCCPDKTWVLCSCCGEAAESIISGRGPNT